VNLRIAILYALFAAIATGVNVTTQWLAVRTWPWPATALAGSIAIGTLTGLTVKYLMDKRWIFRFVTHDVRHNSHTFLLYTLMGGVTTLIFWGSELTFHYLFGSEAMRYFGAMIGLAIGYFSKYQLDKRFVFVNR
jgi:putative flippase GtrA